MHQSNHFPDDVTLSLPEAAERVHRAVLETLTSRTREDGFAWLAAEEIRDRFLAADGCDAKGRKIASPLGWAKTVAVRYLLDTYRHSNVGAEVALLGDADAAQESDEEWPEDRLQSQEAADFRDKVNGLLWKGLDELESDAAMRRALKDYLLTQNLSAAAVARSLGMTRNAFYLKKMRLMARLAAYVRDHLSADERDDLARLL